MARSVRLVALVLTLLAAGCQREAFNWEQPENVLVSKTAVEQPDGSVEMRFVSLMNVPAEHLFNALADVERHAEFIDGVTESKLVTTEGKKKIMDFVE